MEYNSVIKNYSEIHIIHSNKIPIIYGIHFLVDNDHQWMFNLMLLHVF